MSTTEQTPGRAPGSRHPLHGLAHAIGQRYRLTCAREDGYRHGFAIPAGAWVCVDCDYVSWDADGLARHVCGTRTG